MLLSFSSQLFVRKFSTTYNELLPMQHEEESVAGSFEYNECRSVFTIEIKIADKPSLTLTPLQDEVLVGFNDKNGILFLSILRLKTEYSDYTQFGVLFVFPESVPLVKVSVSTENGPE